MDVAETTTAPAARTLIRTLSGIAGYRCGHTGSCCRAGWPIPLEPAPLLLLQRAEADASLPEIGGGAWQAAGVLGRTADNDCVYHDTRGVAVGCRLEHSLTARALPYSCRQFPRLLLADGRGWHQSISAWCGTAAHLIVSGDSDNSAKSPDFLSFSHIRTDWRVHVESLDARDAWPPLLRPGILTGLAAYDRWESLLISEFLRPVSARITPLHDALSEAISWTDTVRAWLPSDGALPVHIDRTVATRVRGTVGFPSGKRESLDFLLNDLLSRIPAQWRPHEWPWKLTDMALDGEPMTLTRAQGALSRYLAVRLVGSWVAYQGNGLRSVIASLVSSYALAALALTRFRGGPVTFGHVTSAIRAADWIQLHLLDREVWAAWCGQTEDEADVRGLLNVVGAAADAMHRLAWAPDQPSG